MAGTRIGGIKAAATNKERYGKDFYRTNGAKGGRNGHTGGFASVTRGKDGLTGPERAKLWGTIGGQISRRGPAKRSSDE